MPVLVLLVIWPL